MTQISTNSVEELRDDIADVLLWTTGQGLRENNPMIEKACQLLEKLGKPICWRCKHNPAVVFDGVAHECGHCAGETAKKMRALLNSIDEEVRDGLPAWPRIADRVEFVRECILLHRQDALRTGRATPQ